MEENKQPEQGKFPGVLGIHTARAVDRMKEGKPGDTITREEMKAIIGRDCQVTSLGYGNVNSAIRVVEREYGIVWRWNKDLQSWQCLNDAGRLTETGSLIKQAKKRSGRALRVGKTINHAALDDDQRRDHNVSMAMAGMMTLCGGSPFRKRLESANGDKLLTEPDPRRLIELMKS